MSDQEENRKINGVIEKLIDKNVGRSFAVCDLNDIITKYESWKLAMPRIKPFYAVKCNNYPPLLQLLADLGIGFDCATKFEIEAILKTTCSPDKIIFASTIKDINHINYADSMGVTLTTFDSLSELHKCKKYYSRAKLLIRIKTYSNNTSNFEDKFGCDPYNDAEILLEAARSLGLNVIGVAFHVGTSCNQTSLFSNAIKLARYVFDIAYRLGFVFDVLDIGGGFTSQKSTTIFEIGSIINKTLEAYFPDESIKIIAEPGRYFVSSSVTLATRVISAKPNRLNSSADELKYLYYVDNGTFNMFQTILHGFSAPSPLAWKNTSSTYASTVFGQTMTPCDVISPNAILPKLDVGDWIIYENMGAYTQCLETAFHLYEPTPVYFIEISNTRHDICEDNKLIKNRCN